MEIREAEFISSITDLKNGPQDGKPEFAFIGRSNVGKSSLVNMVTGRKTLAKISGKPGKTQTINHFLINKTWYLVDLPGYGYAKTSKSLRSGFGQIIEHYVRSNKNLFCLFVLIDIRLEPQANDLDFINWAGQLEVPLGLVFTKSDKLSGNKIRESVNRFEKTLLNSWEETPPVFVTSSAKGTGKNELLDFIHSAMHKND